MPYLSFPRRGSLDFGSDAAGLGHLSDQFINCDRGPGADVENTGNAFRSRGEKIDARYVFNIYKIPSLLTIIVDYQRRFFQHTVSEDGNYVAVCVVTLIDAIDVEITKTYHLHVIEP